MMRILVSVQDEAEALAAATHGADFIDCKEPANGALGGLPPPTIRRIVAALRDAGHAHAVSATIGDWPMHALHAIIDNVHAVAATGADIVKVGIERDPAAFAVIDALRAIDHPIVPVFIADRGLDFDAVGHAAQQGFEGLMVDTADKRAGSLFDVLPLPVLQRFVERARVPGGGLVGMAGALQARHAAALQALAPDFAGFRSAVCEGGRDGTLVPARLQALAQALRTPASAGFPAAAHAREAAPNAG